MFPNQSGGVDPGEVKYLFRPDAAESASSLAFWATASSEAVQSVACLDVLTFLTGNVDQPAADLGTDRCCVEGLNGSNTFQINRNIVGSRFFGENGDDLAAPSISVAVGALARRPGALRRARSVICVATRPPTISIKTKYGRISILQ